MALSRQSLDVAVGVPRSPACTTDRIVDTIDYSKVRAALVELLQHHEHQLLEAFAEAIAQMLIERFGAPWARVVVKPRKFDDVDAVGVAIERSRSAPARNPGPKDATLLPTSAPA
jgi:7,8-dihydroneopterin aldolase/epimerase/oxygenase